MGGLATLTSGKLANQGFTSKMAKMVVVICRRSEKWRREMADEETKIFISERKKKPLLPSEV